MMRAIRYAPSGAGVRDSATENLVGVREPSHLVQHPRQRDVDLGVVRVQRGVALGVAERPLQIAPVPCSPTRMRASRLVAIELLGSSVSTFTSASSATSFWPCILATIAVQQNRGDRIGRLLPHGGDDGLRLVKVVLLNQPLGVRPRRALRCPARPRRPLRTPCALRRPCCPGCTTGPAMTCG